MVVKLFGGAEWEGMAEIYGVAVVAAPTAEAAETLAHAMFSA
jgi:hypothetical protein